MAEKMTCMQCGMPCDTVEYHPYAACLMFTACHDSETVRANLAQPAQAVDAWMTLNEDGDPSMLFFNRQEAMTYCDDDEVPIPLTRAIGNAQTLADSVDPLVIRLHDVTAKLEAANALLRSIAGCQWFNREAPATVELIDAHLSENGHG